jgi:hypothetical protein
MRKWFNSGISCLPKTALRVVHCEVSRCNARGSSFLFPVTEVLLDEIFEPNETILPLPSSRESFGNQLKSIHEMFCTICTVQNLKHYWAWTWDKWLTLYREHDRRVSLHGQVETCSYVKSTIFWDITSCSPLSVNRFGGTCRLHLQGRENCA